MAHTTEHYTASGSGLMFQLVLLDLGALVTTRKTAYQKIHPQALKVFYTSERDVACSFLAE